MRPMQKPTRRHSKNLVLILLACFLASACDIADDHSANTRKAIKSRGEIKVLTRNAPTTVYEGRDGLTGYEYDLVNSFADYLNVKAEFTFLDGIGDILSSIENREGDFAAAGLTQVEERQEAFRFGPAYYDVQQQLICRRGGKIPMNLEEISGVKLHILKDSSYVLRLEELQQQSPGLHWMVSDDLTNEQLLEDVWRRKIDCTIADSNIFSINRRFYPELVVAFPMSETQSLAWLLRKDETGLWELMHDWFQLADENGLLSILHERYYGHVEIFDYVDTKKFTRRVRSRLPRYQKYFLEAETNTGIDWRLLAAQSYQESHWNPRARSPTGVRGMMMLTLTTARSLGIKSRLSAKQSILGGAKYLRQLQGRLPDEISEPDRTWIALAAYNVGMGHIIDARRLAIQEGLNPNLWQDLKRVLPLLSQKRYYKTLKYGYARGSEPVQYVQAIRDYYDLLLQP